LKEAGFWPASLFFMGALNWSEPLITGSAGALAHPSVRSTLNVKTLEAVTVSRFALIAGDGARAPSISLSLSGIPLLGADRRQSLSCFQGSVLLRRCDQ
jgi:hypothetical protein